MTEDRSWLTRTEDHLQAALNVRDPSRKDYPMRSALQQVWVQRHESDQ